MKQWLWDRRLILTVVGITVPLIGSMGFWSVIRPHWLFLLACYLLVFPVGVVAMWAGQRGREYFREYWTRLGRGQRALLRCLAIALLWTVIVLFPDDRPDRFFVATLSTAGVVILWGGYALFSRATDWILLRNRGR